MEISWKHLHQLSERMTRLDIMSNDMIKSIIQEGRIYIMLSGAQKNVPCPLE